MEAPIFDVKRFAIHDGPGIRTTFFLKGCPLHCLWCQNPESISSKQVLMLTEAKCVGCGACVRVCDKPHVGLRLSSRDCSLCGRCVEQCVTGARHFAARMLTPEAVLQEALVDRPFYDQSGGGITFSGGECLMHTSFLQETLCLCKAERLHTVIDTCGAVPTKNLEAVLPYVDMFLYDIKLMDPIRHQKYTGMDNQLILENLRHAATAQKDIVIRIPLIPGYTDAPADIAATGRFLCEELKGKIKRVELLPYNQLAESKYGNQTAYYDGGIGPYALPGLKTQDAAYVQTLCQILEKMQLPVFQEKL